MGERSWAWLARGLRGAPPDEGLPRCFGREGRSCIPFPSVSIAGATDGSLHDNTLLRLLEMFELLRLNFFSRTSAFGLIGSFLLADDHGCGVEDGKRSLGDVAG